MWKALPATVSLIALNVLIFLVVNNLLPAENPAAERLPLYFPENPNFGGWQFVTHMFMHGSMTHLFMNMFGLFSFGSILERIWGMKRFLIFYFAAGIGAGLIYTAVNFFEYQSLFSELTGKGMSGEQINSLMRHADPRAFLNALNRIPVTVLNEADGEKLVDLYLVFNKPVVGASGAIYGILTAFGVMFPNAKLSLIFLPVPIAAKYFIPVLLLMDFFSGITGLSIFGGGIAHFAHLGGALIGFLLMLLWRKDISQEMVQRMGGAPLA